MSNIKLIRKSKAVFFNWGLDRLVPFRSKLVLLGYMAGLSKYMRAQKNIPVNDYPNKKWDYKKRYQLYEELLKMKELTGPVDYLEFGVYRGDSMRWWVEHNSHAESRFHGFDTFEGLPEEWGRFKAGDMTTGGNLPDIPDHRAAFHKGLFQDTLPGFIRQHPFRHRKIIHMDADLYTSTLYVLTYLYPHLKKGDIIIFDEFSVPTHEYLAFMNFVESYRIRYKILVALNNFFFVALELE